jgi:hypothetical protein
LRAFGVLWVLETLAVGTRVEDVGAEVLERGRRGKDAVGVEVPELQVPVDMSKVHPDEQIIGMHVGLVCMHEILNDWQVVAGNPCAT